MWCEDFNLNDVVTPIRVKTLQKFLKQINYDKTESEYILSGFKNGFDLGYRGPWCRKDLSDNLPLRVGNKTILWNKMMEEVKVYRFAGPFKDIPFKGTYVQSPVGLVPKAGGKTRLIFHLSYKFKNGNQSINYWTPESMCSVKYNGLDKAIKDCLRLMNELGIRIIFFVKSDLKSAFRILPLLPKFRCFLLMNAQYPVTKE